MWCVAELDEEYLRRMEDILAVYEKPLSEREPVLCMDEKPVVLHQDVRPPQAMRPGHVARRDGEYRRCGTANVFCGVEPKAGRYFLKVTRDRSSPEFADYLLDLALRHPEADTIHFGTGQSEFAYPQSARRTVRRQSRELAVESIHGPLHAQAWKLAEPGRDCDQPALAAVPGPAPNRRSSRTAQSNPSLESSYESPSCPDSMELHTQNST